MYLEGLRHRLAAAIPTWKLSTVAFIPNAPQKFIAKWYGIVAGRQGTSNSADTAPLSLAQGVA